MDLEEIDPEMMETLDGELGRGDVVLYERRRYVILREVFHVRRDDQYTTMFEMLSRCAFCGEPYTFMVTKKFAWLPMLCEDHKRGLMRKKTA